MQSLSLSRWKLHKNHKLSSLLKQFIAVPFGRRSIKYNLLNLVVAAATTVGNKAREVGSGSPVAGDAVATAEKERTTISVSDASRVHPSSVCARKCIKFVAMGMVREEKAPQVVRVFWATSESNLVGSSMAISGRFLTDPKTTTTRRQTNNTRQTFCPRAESELDKL